MVITPLEHIPLSKIRPPRIVPDHLAKKQAKTVLKRRNDQQRAWINRRCSSPGRVVPCNGEREMRPLVAPRIERRDHARGTSSRLFALGGRQTRRIPAGNWLVML